MSDQFDFEVIYQKIKQLDEEEQLSPCEANIFNFITVFQEQVNLLTEENKSSLQDLLEKLPDDIKLISKEITEWYEKEPHIRKEISKRRNNNFRGAGGGPVKITPQDWMGLLKNSVRISQPLDQQPSQLPKQ